MDLQQISDRLEITDLLTRYTRAVDTAEWDLLDGVFTPDAHIDYSATGGAVGSFPEIKAWLAEALLIFPRRQHLLGQVDSRIAGDTAAVTAYFLNPMVFSPKDRVGQDGSEEIWEFGGFYHHRLLRTSAGWRSRELVEELSWKRGL